MRHTGYAKVVDIGLRHEWKTGLWVKLMDLGAHYGCHQKPERSFIINGYQFPVCARCSGIICAKPFGLFLSKHIKRPVVFFVGMITPMAIDGIRQYLGIKESTNRKRFITGFLGGLGISVFRIAVLKTILSL